ncbi:hypothetical protein ANN_03579 [Periplaneta americana]|uniref:RING-type E3 ubiquitin transferase n=1 Tax=Periplaneta americana TaxID=6978 RepID=A0ABQ8U0I7_PERAM|nr:hypothetical protein ANN_03579 [Periplaneta americana]
MQKCSYSYEVLSEVFRLVGTTATYTSSENDASTSERVLETRDEEGGSVDDDDDDDGVFLLLHKTPDMSVLQEDLLRELECPMCLHYLMPPIGLCKNGHSICKICRNKVQQCPTCKEDFTDNRSISLENIVRGLHYPCHNKTNGCAEVLPNELMMEHEEICGLGVHECPLKKKFTGFVNCKWMGTWDDLKTHIERDHGKQFFVERPNSSPIRNGVCVYFAFKEVFLHEIRRDGDKWYQEWAVQDIEHRHGWWENAGRLTLLHVKLARLKILEIYTDGLVYYTSQMNTVSRDLLRELECPVCLRYFIPPIPLCSNGHSVRNSCRTKVRDCPTCRCAFINYRSLIGQFCF